MGDERKWQVDVDTGMLDSEEVQAWGDAYMEICAALKASQEIPVSAEDWEAPTNKDENLLRTWVHWCLNNVNDRNTAGGCLKAIALKSKTNLKRHWWALQQEFNKQWQEEGQYQTVEGPKKQLDESKKPTALFTLLQGTTRAAEERRECQNIMRGRVGTIAHDIEPGGVKNYEEVQLDDLLHIWHARGAD
ncbi:hypothetical protein HK101_003715, partial [Irineochytrium annulatum]